MGIIMYKMLYGNEPFDGKSEKSIIQKIKQGHLRFPEAI